MNINGPAAAVELRRLKRFRRDLAGLWHCEQDGLQHKIQDVQKGSPAPIDYAVDMLRLTNWTQQGHSCMTSRRQRRLLQVVVEKAAWQDGALRTTLFEPFRDLAPFEPGKL